MMLDALELPDDLLWTDEFTWSPVAQTQDRSVTGGLLVQEQTMAYGRPISFAGEGASWVPRSVVLALQALAAEPDLQMTLTLADEREFTVIFNRADGTPIDARMVMRVAVPDADTLYTITALRLLTVAPAP